MTIFVKTIFLKTAGINSRFMFPVSKKLLCLQPGTYNRHFSTEDPTVQPPPPLSTLSRTRRFFNWMLRRTSTEEVRKTSSPPKSYANRLLSLVSIAPKINSMIIHSKITDDTDLANFLSKTASITIYSFVGVTTLGTFGIDTSAIIAGFGVTGFAIGFALKEILTNFLSGIFLIFQRPFTKGSYVKIHGSGNGIEGLVEAIDIRYVHLKAEGNGGIVKIPSAIVYSNPITVLKPIQTLDEENISAPAVKEPKTGAKIPENL